MLAGLTTCTVCILFHSNQIGTNQASPAVTHYAEGSLMPYLVMKIIFELIPKRTPFFIRPFANLILGGVTSAFLDPTLKQHAEFVRTSDSFC